MSIIDTAAFMQMNELASKNSIGNSVKKAENLASQKIDSQADVDKAAGGFEALLLHQMLKEMYSSIESGGVFGENSNEAGIYKDMFVQAIADSVSSGRGIGVKDFLRKELVKLTDASKAAEDSGANPET